MPDVPKLIQIKTQILKLTFTFFFFLFFFLFNLSEGSVNALVSKC